MFAADSFMYNTDSVTRNSAEPTSGVEIFGNLNALNQVSVERDWYTRKISRWRTEARPAYYDSTNDQWVDLETGAALSRTEINSLRHYQMEITYDDRVRSLETQPPGLPKGKGNIFGGLKSWQEVSGH
jgi:hypothetical protein